MFGLGKQEQERRAQEEQVERERLNTLSEKELMVEMLLALKRIDKKCDDITKLIYFLRN